MCAKKRKVRRHLLLPPLFGRKFFKPLFNFAEVITDRLLSDNVGMIADVLIPGSNYVRMYNYSDYLDVAPPIFILRTPVFLYDLEYTFHYNFELKASRVCRRLKKKGK